MAANKLNSKNTPIKPNSSAYVDIMKSVWCSGKYPKCDCVPSVNPFPIKPPEPMAILDWIIFQPAPNASDSGSNKVSTRFFWYSCKKNIQSKGATTANAPQANAMSRQEIPLRKMTHTPGIKRPRFKSGCKAANKNGNIIMPNEITICINLGGNARPAKYHAIIKGMANFINSEGCMLPIPGRLIQRLAPMRVSPTTKTNTIKITAKMKK